MTASWPMESRDPASAPAPAPAAPASLVARLRAAGCVFAEDEADLLCASASGPALEALVARRVAGEPLELLLGWAEFDGLRIRTAPGVFVPRRRSTLLVRLAAAALGEHTPPGPGHTDLVVDLGCGTGALGAALAARVPAAQVWAVDVDPAAVACARSNLAPGRVLLGDLFDPLPGAMRGSVDVVLANAPYVPTDRISFMPPEARDHEHRVALDGGADGLEVQRRVIAAAPAWLRPGGILVVESSAAQAPTSAALMAAVGLRPRIVEDDEAGAVAVIGTRMRETSAAGSDDGRRPVV